MKAPLPVIHDLPAALKLVSLIMEQLVTLNEKATVSLRLENEEYIISIVEDK